MGTEHEGTAWIVSKLDLGGLNEELLFLKSAAEV